MKITEIVVHYGKTVSDNNYGGDRYDITYTAELEGRDHPDLIQKALWVKAKRWVMARIDGEEGDIPPKRIKKLKRGI